MTQFSHNLSRWTRSLCGTRFYACLLVLGAVTVMGNSNAHASCGDYLYRNGVPVSGHSDAMSKDVSHQTESPSPAPAPARPCQGPNCSKGKSPLAPDAPSTSRLFDRDALLAGCLISQPPLTSRVAAESEAVADVHPATIFRPPKALTSAC